TDLELKKDAQSKESQRLAGAVQNGGVPLAGRRPQPQSRPEPESEPESQLHCVVAAALADDRRPAGAVGGGRRRLRPAVLPVRVRPPAVALGGQLLLLLARPRPQALLPSDSPLSAIGFSVFSAVLCAWALTFAIGGEGLFGSVWNQLVMYNLADKWGLTGWD
ncbi:hypothetical protein EUGRSUZ_I00202, partial [Eucalyptus grandis]